MNKSQASLRSYLPVMGLTLLCGGLAFHAITEKSLWVDEIATYTGTQNWQSMWTLLTQTAPSMGAYYNLMYFWLKISSGEFFMRAVSAFAAIATVPAIYILGKRLFTARVGLMAALLMSFNAFFIFYAQNARSYSLTLLLTCLACYCFLRLVIKPSLTPAPFPPRKRRERGEMRYMVGYVLLSALAMYSHLYAGLVFFANTVSILLLYLLFKKQRPSQPALIVGAGTGLAAAGILAVIPLVYKYSDVLSWIARPDWQSLVNVAVTLAGRTETLLACYGLLMLLVVLAIVRNHSVDWKTIVLVLWLVTPAAISVAVSLVKTPIFVDRYMLVSLPALLLLGCWGLEQLPTIPVKLLGLAILLVLSFGPLQDYYQQTSLDSDWRGAVEQIYQDLQPHDTVISFDREAPVQYYATHLNGDRDPIPVSTIFEPNLPYFPYYLDTPTMNMSLLDSLHDSYSRVWLVFTDTADTPALAQASGVILSGLAHDYRLTNHWDFAGLHLYLYQRTSL